MGRLCLQAGLFVIEDRFTKALLGRGRLLKLDSAQSLAKTGRLCLQAEVLVTPGRFTNELFIRGCVCVILDVGWRNLAVEKAGWR